VSSGAAALCAARRRPGHRGAGITVVKAAPIILTTDHDDLRLARPYYEILPARIRRRSCLIVTGDDDTKRPTS
jgi:hypothetical protein